MLVYQRVILGKAHETCPNLWLSMLVGHIPMPIFWVETIANFYRVFPKKGLPQIIQVRPWLRIETYDLGIPHDLRNLHMIYNSNWSCEGPQKNEANLDDPRNSNPIWYCWFISQFRQFIS